MAGKVEVKSREAQNKDETAVDRETSKWKMVVTRLENSPDTDTTESPKRLSKLYQKVGEKSRGTKSLPAGLCDCARGKHFPEKLLLAFAQCGPIGWGV